MKKEIIKKIGFYYKGHNIIWTEDCNNFQNFLENYFNDKYILHKKYFELYFRQLEQIINDEVKQIDMYNSKSKIVFILNVYVLTKMNLIENNEYNGLLYVTEINY